MGIERKDIFQVAGNPVTIIGRDVVPGELARDFEVTGLDWKKFQGISGTQGKVRILASLPSLDTSVCDRETRRFNQEAVNLSDDIEILVISTDLPYAQRRWCGAAGIERVRVLSDHLDVNFGEKYGVLIKELRILRRAVFVVNRSDLVTYIEYLPSNSVEPDYEAVLEAANAALAESASLLGL
jgi:thioredoxin-dependent peroxiredoxin